MIKVGIVGATGYTGAELIRILQGHPEVKIEVLTSQSYAGQEIAQVFPQLSPLELPVLIEQEQDKLTEVDVAFLALPHGVSMPIAARLLSAGVKVIDLGADFRLKDAVAYQTWYGLEHSYPQLLAEAVYGLPELKREQIAAARLVANPGCYPTSILLALAPALKHGLLHLDTIIADSKSGVSGAGRGVSLGVHFSEVNENFKAYNVGQHRHTAEIEQELAVLAGKPLTITFTPHLVPMTRGILSTVYAKLRQNLEEEEIRAIYRDFYRGEPFVKVLEAGQYPQTKWCAGSNRAFIGLKKDARTGRLILVSAIDNLVKGASGQAVQNMNILFGLPETMGLEETGLWP
ncbi:N-acetyl-gamma-glutamyl-phosphate reductase [Carboxydocella sporoproducens DSM 16521]|uniref:N-acetyl-gamma-glutamyl-phosphate reductase n=2 Tax=Carboxydocella TaxID=178898 RepID=A0A1T4R2F5_9FIRM|nr:MULTISPECIES: N-acetyl-gamma-glutamyl-phosphate reductase [Carboxydocella]AVX21760.1 N-acetyl-gamma-glutamyl-phosphate reductase [Carboxydocella thermautotrophica]SKA10066.1 N-acetyl-gamma-glutamyl-phosphate reductase [Carboxydocella sporoproducens DSM 16521]